MTTTQSYIDQLIQAINDAVEAGSVTNVMVGTILDFLNRRSQELSEQVLTTEAVRFKDPVFLWGNQFDGSADVSGNLHFSQIVCSLIFGDNRHRLEVINLGTAEMPEYVLHSTLPFYSDSWVASGGVGGDSGGGGATSLSELSDVDTSGASSGDTLIFDEQSQKWLAQSPQEVEGDKNYVHIQMQASDTWEVVHNLGKYPSVTVVSDSGNTVVGDVVYTGLNSLTITFNAVFSGRAYMN